MYDKHCESSTAARNLEEWFTAKKARKFSHGFNRESEDFWWFRLRRGVYFLLTHPIARWPAVGHSGDPKKGATDGTDETRMWE